MVFFQIIEKSLAIVCIMANASFGKLMNYFTIEDIFILTGTIFFAFWLIKTSLGRKALVDSNPRRTNMPFYTPFIPLFVWLGPISVAAYVANWLAGDLTQWQRDFLDNIILCAGALLTAALMVFLARATFARRLKGFGFNVKTIPKDIGAAFINLLSVWPLVLAMIILTTFLGKLVWGRDFQMQQHYELELISEHTELPLRISIIILTVVVGPVLEEMLFRGFFQTMIRSLLTKPWLSIFVSSFLFVVVHQNSEHWPALFALAVCLGYAYEKSGSLFRSIFIHSLFNGSAIILTLAQ
jgi:membrane protease YdiL (CAAX protease family)